ncbi:hypothetical protein PBRA_005500 [Plasmodiophora brassicae]|uniref:Uncharacterized protein n=1 Tax=Plasmodiophora brassicae TaxID=37360 RepID=A0A0G4INS8_PLABS|nr:hypothetical protein PBRA_005500 [Plasmodiophora brassicae]
MDTRGTQRNRDHQDPDEEPLNTPVSALTSTIAAIVAEALQAQRADIDAMLRQQRAEILAQVAASPSIVPKTETIDPDRPPTPLSTISYSTPVRLHTFTGDDSVDPMSATTWFDEVSGVDIAGRRRNKVRASGDRRQSVNASSLSRDRQEFADGNVPFLAWHSVHIDHVVDLPKPSRGNGHVLTLTCRMCHSTLFLPVRRRYTAGNSAEALIRFAFGQTGIPGQDYSR